MAKNNESDLTTALSKEFGITQKLADEMIDFQQEWIAKTALEFGEAKLHGYGRFKLKVRPDRVKRNPRTGESVNVAADKTLTYKPYTKTLAILNAE